MLAASGTCLGDYLRLVACASLPLPCFRCNLRWPLTHVCPPTLCSLAEIVFAKKVAAEQLTGLSRDAGSSDGLKDKRDSPASSLV